jgi:hypothetical protein
VRGFIPACLHPHLQFGRNPEDELATPDMQHDVQIVIPGLAPIRFSVSYPGWKLLDYSYRMGELFTVAGVLIEYEYGDEADNYPKTGERPTYSFYSGSHHCIPSTTNSLPSALGRAEAMAAEFATQAETCRAASESLVAELAARKAAKAASEAGASKARAANLTAEEKLANAIGEFVLTIMNEVVEE